MARVGEKARRSLEITAEHVRAYAELTGDWNPLHFDEPFAAATRFGGLVVQGGLTTGMLHALVAMDLPGPGSVFLSQDWKFTAPVRVGDTITAEAEVLGVHATKPVTRLGVRITRQDGEIVLEGEAWCYTMSPEPSAAQVSRPGTRQRDPGIRRVHTHARLRVGPGRGTRLDCPLAERKEDADEASNPAVHRP